MGTQKLVAETLGHPGYQPWAVFYEITVINDNFSWIGVFSASS